jgi:tubulin epsilon
MPRELITVQVGQCGMQLGTKFWELALEEHATHQRAEAKSASSNSRRGGTSKSALHRGQQQGPVFDDAMSSFFRNVDSRNGDLELGVGSPVSRLRARALLVDMEEGVINEVLNGPLQDLFDAKQTVRSTDGSGNNWAHGQHYGAQYGGEVLESLRAVAETCDSLQSFFLMHSLGGGTGSGLGTYITSLLGDAFPKVYRFTTAVFPSAGDDVVTSPYNSVLSSSELIDHSDCVLPVDNQSLAEVVAMINKDTEKEQKRTASREASASLLSSRDARVKKKKQAFADMNRVAAHMLTNLTASMRFEGDLNVDLNEITMNLVPYPRLHFLLSSMSPMSAPRDVRRSVRGVDAMFADILKPAHQLIKCNPRHDTFLALALLVRGPVSISDITRNVTKMKPHVRMVPWNTDGFKVGLCGVAPVGQPMALLSLANNCVMGDTFSALKSRFQLLYRRKAHTHHYTEYMELEAFDAALENVTTLIDQYEDLRRAGAARNPSASAPFGRGARRSTPLI